MEREKDPSEDLGGNPLQTAGRQAADALRGYGYNDFAQEYERTLRRSALDPKEMLPTAVLPTPPLKNSMICLNKNWASIRPWSTTLRFSKS